MMFALEALTLPTLYTLAFFGGCTAQPMPRVMVDIAHAPIRYDYTQPKHKLAGFKIDTISPYAADEHAEIGGLMGGQVTVKSDVGITGTRSRLTGEGCYWYDDIKIVIETDPVIYVAREFPKGSCRHEAILVHEKKHVRVDREVVGDFIPKIELAVKNAIHNKTTVGPTESEMEAVRQQMSARVEKAVAAVSEDMYAMRRSKQQALDSRKEYERISNSCPNG